MAALKILLESMDKPRMMVLVKEESGRNADEGAIVEYLTEKGFPVVDTATVAGLMKKDDALLKAAIGGDAMAAIYDKRKSFVSDETLCWEMMPVASL
ncbi:MAG: hypothetical protein ABFS09_09455 [Thermodesulfobacteriota bacterium]